MFKVTNKDIRRSSIAFIANFEQISLLFLVFLLLTFVCCLVFKSLVVS